MKIFIINPISNGGLCQYTYSLCNALYKKGVDFVLLTTKNKNEIDYFPLKFNVKKILYPLTNSILLKGLYYFLNKHKIKKLIKAEKPAIIHFQWPLSARFDPKFIKILQKGGIKIVYTAHNILPHEVLAKHKKIYNRIYRTVDKIIVHAEQNKIELIQGFNIPKEKIEVIPHGNFIEVAKLNPELTKFEARQILGLERNAFYILFFGNIRPYRGLDILLKAMVYLKNIPRIKLIVAGQMKEVSICEDLVDLLRIRDAITFYLEYIPLRYVGQYFYASDVAIFPYRKIYQSGAIHMAYAFRRPVISTKVGGIPEIVDNGKSGLLIPPEDPKILAKAILKMYNAPKKQLERIGEYTYNLAKTKFSWDKIANKTIKLYQEIYK